jgi:hypothetical protein
MSHLTDFIVVDVRHCAVTPVRCKDFAVALKKAGLQVARIDFAEVASGISIVVYEFGLFEPPAKQKYFSINGNLYAGNALLFGHDKIGETINLTEPPPVTFYSSGEAVERAIGTGEIKRPVISVNGRAIWQWPAPAPKEYTR